MNKQTRHSIPRSLPQIERAILTIRSQRVILDTDLARLYGVPTKALNQAMRRNQSRFPADFAFRLTQMEKEKVVTICDHLRKIRFSPALPYAFTEHGAVMAANVLNSPAAVEASVYVVRAFVHLREAVLAHRELARKLTELERRVGTHDQTIQRLVAAMRGLMEPVAPLARRRIGFGAAGSRGTEGRSARICSSRAPSPSRSRE